MLTVNELNKLIGKQATIKCDGCIFDIKIIDVKTAYGNQRVQIVPVSGNGSRWVDINSIKIK